jgi:predicted transglutaminase-like cysteine proteinase
MLKLLLAACLVVSSAQAVPETTKPVKLVVEIPVDQIARAKFPNEDGKLVDALASVNDYVNKNMTYVTDQAHYGYEDFWVMAPSITRGIAKTTPLRSYSCFSGRASPLSAIPRSLP